ncbi:hypothetical protein PV682_15070 [Streptomyces niveiscabiei]|uniref:hypothetical protein n=1 Tax=Streptomyces niveiscabiei TaxID=164115 RepID=UPI0029BC6BDA|nr:hypothetical protein [Streptomyces niveiscabiei]MDX3382780.1 hypothetical protein [Streptomyces niveiscabiei]
MVQPPLERFGARVRPIRIMITWGAVGTYLATLGSPWSGLAAIGLAGGSSDAHSSPEGGRTAVSRVMGVGGCSAA